MSYRPIVRRSPVARAVYGLLNPIPFGLFVGGLIFDGVYSGSGNMMWAKGAAWMITLGLVFAIIPRIGNLVQVWITSRRTVARAERLDFWLNLVAIVAAVLNAFVHTRDAYSIIPAGVWLSAITVILLAIAHVVIAVRVVVPGETIHE
jgi:uncharacterized membrane protein